jgi:hypothetical protein
MMDGSASDSHDVRWNGDRFEPGLGSYRLAS